MQVDAPVCLECKHYDEFTSTEMVCKAYPKGIPDKYKLSEEIHTKEVNGYKYEPITNSVLKSL